MLKGFDLSHHNNDSIFNQCRENGDFIIIKATEGRTYTDTKFKERIVKIKDGLCGVYHYARPENNTPIEEVNNFYNAIKDFITDTMLIVIDWEGNSLLHSFDWAVKFCELISEKTHRPCIIYASASVVARYAKNYKYWWTAHYNKNCANGCTHDNVNEIMVQYTSTPYDIDIFNGNIEDWLALCRNTKKEQKEKTLAEWEENGKIYSVICEEKQ